MPEAPQFARHAAVASDLAPLFEAGAVLRIDPDAEQAVHAPEVAAAALRDLADPEWVEMASRASGYGLPTHTAASAEPPRWEIFPRKLGRALEAALRSPEMASHALSPFPPPPAPATPLRRADTWTLSYAAGSAAAINTHLAVAAAHGFAPVTDSRLHHDLVPRSLARGPQDPLGIESAQVQHAAGVGLGILERLLPRDRLAAISIEEILAFRAETRSTRLAFHRDVALRVRAMAAEASGATLEARVVLELDDQIRQHQTALGAARDRILPAAYQAVPGVLGTIVLGNTVAGPIGGAVGAAISLVAAALPLRADHKAARRAVSPAVTYLAQVPKLG